MMLRNVLVLGFQMIYFLAVPIRHMLRMGKNAIVDLLLIVW